MKTLKAPGDLRPRMCLACHQIKQVLRPHDLRSPFSQIAGTHDDHDDDDADHDDDEDDDDDDDDDDDEDAIYCCYYGNARVGVL